jgi:hypothetical protein
MLSEEIKSITKESGQSVDGFEYDKTECFEKI